MRLLCDHSVIKVKYIDNVLDFKVASGHMILEILRF